MLALTPSQLLARRYTHAVFAGGGNRCWWQAGLVEVLARQACWEVVHLVGASAGAGIAAAFATGRLRDALETAATRFDDTPANVQWRELLRGRRPFPLPAIYRDWVASFVDAAGHARLAAAAPRVEVAITRVTRWLPHALGAGLALGLYATERLWARSFHDPFPRRFGLRPQYLDLAQSRDAGEACRWLSASAAAVPIAPGVRLDGRLALDGGFYDNVPLPLDAASHASTLVLLNEHQPGLPRAFELGGRAYLQPAWPVAAVKLDCTRGDAVRRTFEQGRHEALELLARG